MKEADIARQKVKLKRRLDESHPLPTATDAKYALELTRHMLGTEWTQMRDN